MSQTRKVSKMSRCEVCDKNVHARGMGGHQQSKEHRANLAKLGGGEDVIASVRKPTGKTVNIAEWRQGYRDGFRDGSSFAA